MTSTGQISPEALARLLDQHSRPLELYASQWCQSPEDCVQDAFVGLAAQIPVPENSVAWLYRVVRNLALNASRSAQRRDAHEKQRPFRPESKPADPVEAAAQAEQTRQLLEHLETLEAEDKEIVVLRIWSGLTWEQIADLTGMSSSNAQRRYVKAIEQLGTLMKKNV